MRRRAPGAMRTKIAETAGPPAAVPDPKHRERIRDIGTENHRVITMEWTFEGSRSSSPAS